jgi:hypothetical protein
MYGRPSQERLSRLGEAAADLRDKPARSRREEIQYVTTTQLQMRELRSARRHAEALSVGVESLAAVRALHARWPRRYDGLLAECLANQVDALVADLPESIGEIRLLTDEAFDVMRPWLKDTPAQRAPLVATVHGARGHAELEAGDVDAAEQQLWRAFDAARRMRRRDRTTPQQLAWLAGVVGALARCREAKGDIAEAERLAGKAWELAEAGKAVRLAGKEMWAAVSEVGDVFRGRAARASDADDEG